MVQPTLPTKPYLTREATNQILEKLGFDFHIDWRLRTGQEDKVQALEELIAGAIAEWANVEVGENTVAELQEWAEEWLFG